MNFAALGRDPAPGDPERVENTAGIFRSVSRDAKDTRNRLQAISDSSIDAVWTGDAAKAFERSLHELCGDLDRLTNSYGEAGDALATYAAELQRCKDDAQQAEASAEAAQADQANFDRRHREAAERSAAYAAQSRSAQGRILASRLQQTMSNAIGDVAGATSAQNNITQDLHVGREADAARSQADSDARYAATQAGSAEQRLIAARRLANQVSELQHDAGDVAATKIDQASKIADKYHRNTFEIVLQDFKDIVSSPEFDAFLTALADVGSVLTAAAPFVGIFAPEVAAAMYATGLGLTAAVALGRIAQAAMDHRRTGEAVDASVDLGFALLGGFGKAGALVNPAKNLNWLKDARAFPGKFGADVKRLVSQPFHTADVPRFIQDLPHNTGVSAAARTIVARGYFAGNVVMRPVALISKPAELVSSGHELVADVVGHGEHEPNALQRSVKNADRASTAWEQLWEPAARGRK